MPHPPRPRRLPHARSRMRRRLLVLVPGLVATVVLAGCGGSDASDEQSADAAMAQAKENFDEASSVHIALSTEAMPSSGNGVLGATGTVTRDPAFEGEVKVVLGGLTATVPVTSVGGEVWAKLPLQTKYSMIDPGEYGAPDPADFADPDDGLSALLTRMEGLEKGGETRSGEQILTSYTGSVPGAAVKRIIPSADAQESYRTRVGIDEAGYLATVRVTGIFFSGSDDVTYDVEFDRYDEDVTITPPA